MCSSLSGCSHMLSERKIAHIHIPTYAMSEFKIPKYMNIAPIH